MSATEQASTELRNDGLSVGVLTRICKETQYGTLIQAANNTLPVHTDKRSSIGGRELEKRFQQAADEFLDPKGGFVASTTDSSMVRTLGSDVRNSLAMLLRNSEINSEKQRESLNDKVLKIIGKYFTPRLKATSVRNKANKKRAIRAARKKVTDAKDAFCEQLNREFKFLNADVNFDTNDIEIPGPTLTIETLKIIVQFWIDNPNGDPETLVNYLNDKFDANGEWFTSDVDLKKERKQEAALWIEGGERDLAYVNVLEHIRDELDDQLHLTDTDGFLEAIQENPVAFETYLQEVSDQNGKFRRFLTWIKFVTHLVNTHDAIDKLIGEQKEGATDLFKPIDFSAYEPKPKTDEANKPPTPNPTPAQPEPEIQTQATIPLAFIDIQRILGLQITPGNRPKAVAKILNELSGNSFTWTPENVKISQKLVLLQRKRFQHWCGAGVGAYAGVLRELEILTWIKNNKEQASQCFHPELFAKIEATDLDKICEDLTAKWNKKHTKTPPPIADLSELIA